MKREIKNRWWLLGWLLVMGASVVAFADNLQSTRPVWQIWQSDNNTAEFALGPGESGRFAEEFGAGTLYQVGVSEARLPLLQFYIYSPCY